MNKLRIVALGGLDENGKNLYCIEINDRILIVNAGLKYPEESQFGVEYIVPDFSYLIENQDKILGVILTHAHDDMMNALPNLLQVVNVPVYGPQMCKYALKRLMTEEEYSKLNYTVVERNGEFKVKDIKVETFALTHSTPDAIGISIHTPKGQIVIAEQFLVDFDMHDKGFDSDLARIAELGKENVLVLMMESSYVENEFFTAPKHRVFNYLKPIFEDAEGRIFVTIYDQNYIRVKEVLTLAKEYNKKVYFYGGNLKKRLDDLIQTGYYHYPKGIVQDISKFNNDDDDVVVIVSGPGQKIFDTMNKLATGETETSELRDTDTVIIASPAVAGFEKKATAMENELYKDNINVFKLDPKQVLSAHPSSQDMKLLLNLLKPKYFLPVQGYYRDFVSAANLAMQVGYTPDRIIILDNGQIATFTDGNLISCSELIDTGEQMVGDDREKNIASFVVRDRETLSTDGVIIVGIAINYNTKEIIAGPDIQSRGLIYVKDSEYVIKNVGAMVVDLINKRVAEGTYENMACRSELREQISRYVSRETGKRPMILPAIIEINI